MVVALSSITPDYEDFVTQFTAALSTKESWNSDLTTSSTGRTLIEAISQVGAYDQLSIERALQETYLDTARIPTSVYTITRMLGAHVKRRTPANMSVTFSRTGSTASTLSIPAFSKFSMGGVLLYNAEAIVFTLNSSSVMATLYEGTVVTETFVSDGTGFQTMELGSINFAVADPHIQCVVGTTTYTKTREGLWSLGSADTYFHENTTPEGKVEIIFGNDIYGKIPTTGDNIVFTYANTNGVDANQTTTGKTIASLDYSYVSGVPSSSLTQGEEEEDAGFYRVVAPSVFAAQGRAVTREDYRGKILEYAGVTDCIVRAQAELNPTNVTWMNTLGITILANSTWSTTQWDTFVAWLDTIGMGHVQYVRLDPIVVTVDVTATVYCFKKTDLNDAQAKANTAIIDYFTPTIGSIGRSMYKTDIEDAIFKAFDGDTVDYIKLSLPAIDYEINADEYINLGTVTVTTEFTSRNQLVF